MQGAGQEDARPSWSVLTDWLFLSGNAEELIQKHNAFLVLTEPVVRLLSGGRQPLNIVCQSVG